MIADEVRQLIFEYLKDSLKIECDIDLDLNPSPNYGTEVESATANVRVYLKNPYYNYYENRDREEEWVEIKN